MAWRRSANGRDAWPKSPVCSATVGWESCLKREGASLNKKEIFRLYRDEGLAKRQSRVRKWEHGTRTSMALPDRPNQR